MIKKDDELTNWELIYIKRNDALKSFNFHIIYTVPLGWIYSLHGSRLGEIYGNEPVVLPMVKIYNRETKEEYEKGIDSLVELIRKRIDIEKIFGGNLNLIKKICKQSGGVLRDFIRIIRYAADECDVLPITEKAVDKAFSKIITAYSRAVPVEYLAKLINIFETNEMPQEKNNTENMIMLNSLMVIEYQNGSQPWYKLHPAVEQLKIFKDKIAEKKRSPEK